MLGGSTIKVEARKKGEGKERAQECCCESVKVERCCCMHCHMPQNALATELNLAYNRLAVPVSDKWGNPG